MKGSKRIVTKIITNPQTGRMETVADPKSEATPETAREARRQLREKLNPSGEGGGTRTNSGRTAMFRFFETWSGG